MDDRAILQQFATMRSLFMAFLVPTTCLAMLNSGLGSDDEVRLIETLFEGQGYNPLIRPVKNLSEKVTIKFGLAMIQLINVDEKNQIMKSNVWLRMYWQDYQLNWEAGEYGGINVIRVLASKVWKPDIVLFNNADGKYEVSYKPNAVVFSTGHVLWIPPAIYKSSCTIDVTYFPFDQQECDMKFGSWTFNGDQVILDWYEGQRKVDLSDYVSSGTWDIIACPGRYHYVEDKLDGSHRAWITFTLKIRRKTLFYTVNLIIPCVLISFLSVCVFYLPADAGEKMTMCISILLALVVFLLLVSKILPPTSITLPLIAKYLLFTFLMNILTIVLAVVITNWNFRTPRTHDMPRWVRVVFLDALPRLLLMRRPHHADRCCAVKSYNRRNYLSTTPESDDVADDVESVGVVVAPSGGADQNGCLCAVGEGSSVTATSAAGAQLQSGSGGGGGNIGLKLSLNVETRKAIEAVKFIAAHLKQEDDFAEVLDDWRYIAMVIDRLQLYVFLAVTVGGTVLILCHAPHIFDYIDQDDIRNRLISSNDGVL